MKSKLIATSLLLAGFLSPAVAPRALAESHKEESQADLRAKAKITEAQAQSIALAKVPNGKIKEGGIENEKDRLVWSFDIAVPGTADITEVQVDANSGEIVSVATETPKDEAREARSEKKHKGKKAKQEKDEDDEDDEKKTK